MNRLHIFSLYTIFVETSAMPHSKNRIYMNRLYPIGIQNFEKLRKGGFVYVDKTALIHRLVSTGGYYFFGRPRRFGKSLMISTLESYFEGRKRICFRDLQ